MQIRANNDREQTVKAILMMVQFQVESGFLVASVIRLKFRLHYFHEGLLRRSMERIVNTQ